MNRTFVPRWMALALIFPSALFGQSKVINSFPTVLSAEQLTIPPQGEGLPYTQSSRARGLAAIKNGLAVFAGSRYGYVSGYKVRLDDEHILSGEAIIQEGQIYVPERFASYLTLKTVQPDPPPSYLVSKWVYTLAHPVPAAWPAAKTIEVRGQTYLALAEAAHSLNLKTFQSQRGLLLISRKAIEYDDKNEVLADCVVTLFDTPEKLMDPAIATKYVPTLKAQGTWLDYVKPTLEQVKSLEGPERVYPETPESAYDLTGFNKALLGSSVPPPGVFPRILFSPEDLPMIREMVEKGTANQRSMIDIETLFKRSFWDPKTPDGQVFEKLSSGHLEGLTFPRPETTAPPFDYAGQTFAGEKPGIYNSHVAYVPNCLVAMAFYCLMKNDDALGQKVATAIANYFKLREPILDDCVQMSDTELGQDHNWANGAETSFRGIHGLVAHMDLALALDFSGRWMTPDQKELMYRFIAKATYGRRSNGQDGPARWRDNNWITWHLTNVLAQMAIEGQPGYDPEVYQIGRETVRSFLEWGIDRNGQIFESNGKNGGGLQFLILSMIAMDRRGEKLWGHPHWRKLLSAQAYCTSPNGKVTLSGGTWGGSGLSAQAVAEISAFYPGDKAGDYLLSVAYPEMGLGDFSPEKYRAKIQDRNILRRLRLPSPTYPSMVRALPFNKDWRKIGRADLNQPLDWNDDVHGVFSSSSDNTENAAWMSFLVRPNHYTGSGHHHADAGMFYFSGLGVNWFTMSPFPKAYDGRLHNEVLIDGISENNGTPAKAKYFGAVLQPAGAFATADLTYAYTWQWTTQVADWKTIINSGDDKFLQRGWELEPDQEVIDTMKGTQHYKQRIWWPTYNFSNWMPTLRAHWNPVKYVFRSVGLIRGPHPYSLVIDDLKKDDFDHLYQWTACLGPGVGKIDGKNLSTAPFSWWNLFSQPPGLQPGEVVLARKSDIKSGTVAEGAPLLLVDNLDDSGKAQAVAETAQDGAKEKGIPAPYDRVAVNLKASQAQFKVLLIPFHMGEKLPQISFEAKTNHALVAWADQRDELNFKVDANNRTRATINRGGATVISTP